MDVLNDSSVLTTMAHSTSARIAFMFGMPLPLDDEVQIKYVELHICSREMIVTCVFNYGYFT